MRAHPETRITRCKSPLSFGGAKNTIRDAMSQHVGTMEEKPERVKERSVTTNFDNSEFYTAVMDQDVRRIQDMCRKHRSNCPIEIRGDAAGGKRISSFPLHLAASHRRLQSMQSLLSAGADAELRDQLGRNPLHLVITGWPDIPAAGPEPNSKFHSAVMDVCRQAEACLRLLCEHGVDVNAKMVRGNTHQTALHESVRRRALPAVQILASYGADVHAVDSSGMTPLHIAAGMCHKDIMKSLISHEAEVNKRTRHSGDTPLHIAAVTMAIKTSKHQEDHTSSMSALIESGADPNILNNAGLTPLQMACGVGTEALVDLLLEHGADINKPSQAGENCLFLFLNHKPNVKKKSLLVKLLSLSSPLSVYNRKGQLPSALTEQCFSRQRDQLLRLTQQPKRLKDICKTVIYLKYVRGQKNTLRTVLPKKLYDFVFNQWENIHNIHFDTEKEEF